MRETIEPLVTREQWYQVCDPHNPVIANAGLRVELTYWAAETFCLQRTQQQEDDSVSIWRIPDLASLRAAPSTTWTPGGSWSRYNERQESIVYVPGAPSTESLSISPRIVGSQRGLRCQRIWLLDGDSNSASWASHLHPDGKFDADQAVLMWYKIHIDHLLKMVCDDSLLFTYLRLLSELIRSMRVEKQFKHTAGLQNLIVEWLTSLAEQKRLDGDSWLVTRPMLHDLFSLLAWTSPQSLARML